MNTDLMLTLNPLSPIDEGGTTTLTGVVGNVQVGSTITVDINWGDPNSPNNEEQIEIEDGGFDDLDGQANGTVQFSRDRLYLDDNPSVTPQDTYTIDVTATEAPLIMGTDAVLVIDVSGSTGDPFGGDPIGDRNGDGNSNTILDAEIAAFQALNQDLIDRGLGNTSNVSIVAFNASGAQIDMNPSQSGVQLATTPLADNDNNGVRDVEQALMSLNSGGGTNFEAALQDTISTLNSVGTPAGEGNVVFLSDGVSTVGGSFTDEANAITNTLGQNLRAFGIGSGASLAQLQQLDPNAELLTSTNQLLDIFGSGGGTQVGETTTVLVQNVAPEVDANTDLVTVEGGETATNSGTFSDVGVNDTVTLSASAGTVVDDGNGTWSWDFDTTNAPIGVQKVTVTATDDDGGETATTFDLTVESAPVELELTQEFTNVETEVDTDGDGTIDRFIALPGGNVTFTITVKNTASTAVADVVVFDDVTQVLPVGLDVLSVNTGGGTLLDTDNNDRTLEVEFDSIGAGQSKTITVNARVSDEFLTSFNIAGQLGSDNPALPEYFGASFKGTGYFHLGLDKNAGDEVVSFDFLNLTNEAQVISVGGQTIDPTLFADSATLDISTLDLEGALNNGESFQLRAVAPFDGSATSYVFNPDPLYGSGGSAQNTSQFLPPGETGSFLLDALWNKIDDPAFDAAFAAWTNLSADGDLSDTTDEQAVLDAIDEFIEDGVTRSELYNSGSLDLDNGSQTAGVGVDELAITPVFEAFVTVTANDSGATVGGQTFASLQGALNSLNFSQPTGVNIAIADTNGNGIVQTALQELRGFNFDRNWGVEEIILNGNIDEAIFALGNGSSDVDFSLQTVVANSADGITILGENGKDTIVGSALDDVINGGNGNDELSGSAGDDAIDGGRGKDVLIGGRGNDILTGGNGRDEFVFGFEFDSNTVDVVTDFHRQDDINLTAFNLNGNDLDSTGNGTVDGNDTRVSLVGGNLEIDLTDFLGGTIELQGVSAVNLSAFVL